MLEKVEILPGASIVDGSYEQLEIIPRPDDTIYFGISDSDDKFIASIVIDKEKVEQWIKGKPGDFTCPKGHTLDGGQFHSYYDNNKKTVTFNCPGGKRGHSFTLEQAVKSRMFTAEQGKRILAGGKQAWEG